MTEFSTRVSAGPDIIFPEVRLFQEVTTVGNAFERGLTYGKRVPQLIEHSIATYARMFACRLGKNWASCQEAALAYRPFLEAHAHDELEEMRGIAEGSNRALGEILALNVRTELLAGRSGLDNLHPEWQEALFANAAAGVPSHPDDGGEMLVSGDEMGSQGFTYDDARTHGGRSAGAESAGFDTFGECTAAAAQPAATAGGATILAQTWDWQGDQRAACVLLRIYARNEPYIITLTEAGIIAKHGFNDKGIAVSLNMMRSTSDGQEIGMPIHVLLRQMLRAKSFDDAKAAASAHESTASSCIVLASARGELSALEITPKGVFEVPPEHGRLCHTNHAQHPSAQVEQCPIRDSDSTLDRHRRACELLSLATVGAAGGRSAKKLTLDDFKALLRDHGGAPRAICRHPNKKLAAVHRSETVCAFIMDLGVLEMHIAPTLPCSCAFETVQLELKEVGQSTISTQLIVDSCTVCLPS
jgi:isopenicillin-N N-acyltransferase-like protein